MDTSGILVDSSIIIEFFRRQNKEKSFLYQLLQQNENLFISVLTIYELLCGAKSAKLRTDTEQLLDLFTFLDFSAREAVKAAELYRTLKAKNQIISILDILIAATAICFSLKIATLNVNHFQRFDVHLNILSVKHATDE